MHSGLREAVPVYLSSVLFNELVNLNNISASDFRCTCDQHQPESACQEQVATEGIDRLSAVTLEIFPHSSLNSCPDRDRPLLTSFSANLNDAILKP